MRALREALPAAAVAERSAKIRARLAALDAFDRARSIGLYWPMQARNEVDLAPLHAEARSAGKRIFYPFMDPKDGGYRTGFREVDDPALLVERGRGFAEPPPGLPEAARGDVDLVVVPALAVAPDGHRLGYGAGFYDATLPDVCPPAVSVVVAYSFQLVSEIPPGNGDVACDLVVTDDRVLSAR